MRRSGPGIPERVVLQIVTASCANVFMFWVRTFATWRQLLARVGILVWFRWVCDASCCCPVLG